MLRTETLDHCPLCNGTAFRHLLTAPDYESHTGAYGIDECGNCGVAFTNPRPLEEELPKLYEQRSSTDFPRMDHQFVIRLRDYSVDRYVRAQLGTDFGHGADDLHVLDFGCGDGALARGLVRFGQRSHPNLRVTAVDFHNAAPLALAAESSVVRYRPYDDWRINQGRYDAIFLRHVLEHHPEPCRLLGALGHTLRSGGRLFIEVPNRASVWARVFGKAFCGYYVPRHLLHFDALSLRTTIEQAEMRCVCVKFGHTPLLGRSLGYVIGRDIGNTGLIGLATYPIQVGLDMVARTSTTLRATAMARG